MSEITEEILRRSKVLRSKSSREIVARLAIEEHDSVFILSDQDTLAIKRIVTSSYLDFPKVLRGKNLHGSLPIGDTLENTEIANFLTSYVKEKAIVFFEPWAMRGAAIVSSHALKERFWDALTYCDYDMKIYDMALKISCIISEGEADTISFDIAC